jgi:hypothetical protein
MGPDPSQDQFLRDFVKEDFLEIEEVDYPDEDYPFFEDMLKALQEGKDVFLPGFLDNR